MTRLLGQLEEERRKLNELGKKSLDQGIPLFENEAVQAQSRKVDEWIVQWLDALVWKRSVGCALWGPRLAQPWVSSTITA